MNAEATLSAVNLVLVVEDERDIAETLELYLRSEHFRTERASDGEQALALFRAARPDLVLLDVMLPAKDGLEVLKTIRAESRVPVIMLTARAEEVDKLLGLGLGADDYVVKPFSPRELMARVKAVLRRSKAEGDARAPIRVGPLEINPYAVAVHVAGRPLRLTPTEFRLLHHLARTPGRAVSRAELVEAAMPESDALERAVDVHLKNVRHKLAEGGAAELLETVRGVGYRLAGGP